MLMLLTLLEPSDLIYKFILLFSPLPLLYLNRGTVACPLENLIQVSDHRIASTFGTDLRLGSYISSRLPALHLTLFPSPSSFVILEFGTVPGILH